MLKVFADYHTHTKHSDGRGTMQDNMLAAVGMGLEELGITDHGPHNIGVGVENSEAYLNIKKEARELNEKQNDIKILVGAEADIISVDGDIDVSAQVAKELDLLIVGLHPFVIPETLGDAAEFVLANQVGKVSTLVRDKVTVTNTKALKEAIYKYDIDIISHPDLQMHVDIDELAKVCLKKDVALEINTGHHYDKTELVRQAAPTGVNFVINSDAHFPESVGKLEDGVLLMEKFNIPAERIINAREVNIS